MQKTQSHIDNDQFRAVLGNYPTGVAVVTGMAANGEPLGMVVGTFTSVSLNPPLVAFLPMKTSRTFNALRDASERFCINILAADQEGICRTLAAPGERKFDHVEWHESPLGNPVINGVVGWIDCTYANVVDGGDHLIVLGAVEHMRLERDASPLLFFQRGYGRFSTGPLMLSNDRNVLQSVRLAEQAREDIEALSQSLKVGCSIIAAAGTDSIYVAVADHSVGHSNTNRLGVRAPLTPPLGAVFVGSSNAIDEDTWLARLGKCAPETREQAILQLKLVRERGWSLSLMGAPAQELEEALDLYSCPHRTPEQERRFLATVSRMFAMHEPISIDAEKSYNVLHLTVPVKHSNGDTLLALRLSELPSGLTGRQIENYVQQLQGVAARIEAKIAVCPNDVDKQPI